MRDEYDFSLGIKGKFHVNESEIEIPVYLEKANSECFLALSRDRNIDLSRLVNDVLAKDREPVDSIKG